MLSFAIMRCQKIKSQTSLVHSLKHCFRQQPTPNADPQRTPLNRHTHAKSVDEAIALFQARLPAKVRKNAVYAIEYVMTASPEWFAQASEQQKLDFYEASYQWLVQKYGIDNIFVSSVHLDETTPHVSAFVIPINAKGRLSARDFIGGKRDALRQDQDSYAQAVAHLGIRRGIEKSKAKHVRIQDYYTNIKAPLTPIKITSQDIAPQKKGFLSYESDEEVAQRVHQKIKSVVLPLHDKIIEGHLARKRIEELQQIIKERDENIAKMEKYHAQEKARLEAERDLAIKEGHKSIKLANEAMKRYESFDQFKSEFPDEYQKIVNYVETFKLRKQREKLDLARKTYYEKFVHHEAWLIPTTSCDEVDWHQNAGFIKYPNSEAHVDSYAFRENGRDILQFTYDWDDQLIKMATESDDAIACAMQVLTKQSGSNQIKIKGSNEFKRKAAYIAHAQGVEIIGDPYAEKIQTELMKLDQRIKIGQEAQDKEKQVQRTNTSDNQYSM